MRINIKGEPNELIKKCKKCKYCIFEDILTKEQRQIKVLKNKMPKKHIHRVIVEQVCGGQYDDVCPMKYAAMKASVDDRTAMQLGVIKNYLWDLGRCNSEDINYQKAMQKWTEDQTLGRNRKESYAERYEELWNRGCRLHLVDDEYVEKQILTVDLIYETIMSNSINYENMLKSLDILKREHGERDREERGVV